MKTTTFLSTALAVCCVALTAAAGAPSFEPEQRAPTGDHPLAVGSTVPAFDLPSLDQPGRRITDRSLRGTYYLIDFWGTWCSPCIKEMPKLHEVYERFSNRGLEILAIASRDTEEQVRRFRRKWPMPWLNTVVTKDQEPELNGERFGVRAYPTLALIDPEGRVVEYGRSLRGPRLAETLEKHLPE